LLKKKRDSNHEATIKKKAESHSSTRIKEESAKDYFSNQQHRMQSKEKEATKDNCMYCYKLNNDFALY